MLPPTPDWYNLALKFPVSPKGLTVPTVADASALQSRGESLHSAEVSSYVSSSNSNALTASSSDAAFLQRVLDSGTLSDRLSALTLMAQSSPVHNIRALESLKTMCQKKGKEESLKALRAVVDWWVGGGAPARKLRYFRDQPLTHPDISDKHLLLWYFEDWLKKYFFSILQIMETLSLDSLPYVRIQTMSLIQTLLREKPEQEQNLLRLLVNKLGDSERHVASRASYYLLSLLQAHPQMKAVVVREMTSLVLRPIRTALPTPLQMIPPHTKSNDEKKDVQRSHSKYYATITFNQIMLTPTAADREVAVQLINIYFELFKEILGDGLDSDGEPHTQRSTDNKADDEERGKGKFRGSKKGKKNGNRKEAHGEAGFTEVEDSNSRLTSAILTGVNRALPFAKLDVGDVSFSKQVDTLFLVTHTSSFNVSLQALRLILQICISQISSSSTSNKFETITSRYYRTLYASLQDPRLAVSSKQAMYLNLLFKSLKTDKNVERVKAFIRRFVQLLVSGGNGGAELVAGGLFLLGQLFSSETGIKHILDSKSENLNLTSSDIDHLDEEYDPRKRDPRFAHASRSPLWELAPLLNHYHPTIRLHTSQLISGECLTANADLSLNTLSHFLDLFVYKNPKKPKPRGASAMQPAAAAHDGLGVRLIKGNHADVQGTLNEEEFRKRRAQDIPVDQVFFHSYFSRKNDKENAKGEKVAKRRAVPDNTDVDVRNDRSEASGRKSIVETHEEDYESGEEEEIWKAMKASIPELGDNDSDFTKEDEDIEDQNGNVVLRHDGIGSEVSLEDEESEGGMSLAEGSDEEDLFGLDADLPAGLVEYQSGSPVEDGGAEWDGIGGKLKKRKREENARDAQGRKKLRSLPMFASYEDYAKMIEEPGSD